MSIDNEWITRCLALPIVLILTFAVQAGAQEVKRITILYDAFGVPSMLQKDWGFAALVEYGGRRILFDAGNNAKILEKILAEAAKLDTRLYTVTGGFHLVLTPQEEMQRVASVLQDTLKIERVAPGHCTSELGFAVFLDRFKERFDQAGLGAGISLP